ncbi:MAG: choice-of-anchor D domain-containing protein [Chlorobiota bacterium]
MKKVILILLFLPIIASAQSFNVFDIDTSEYPIMKAKFYSIDENGDQILNHTTSDFEITENGNPAEVLSVSCPEPLPIPLSVGIMVDTHHEINLARHGSERFVNFLKMPQNEIGFTYMNGRPLLFQDFVKDKQKAISSSKQIPPAPGGTSLSEMFFDDYTGGIELIKNREVQNRVLIFISDLHCPNLNIDEQELIQQAIDNNIRIFSVLLGTTDYTGLFKRISSSTKGVVFENLKDSSEIRNVFDDIFFRVQNDPCEIVWNGIPTCEYSSNIEILNKVNKKKFKKELGLSDKQILSLEPDKYFVNLGIRNRDTIITVTSKNSSHRISNIFFDPDNGNFEISSPLPITIPKNSSVDIKLSYTSKDDSREYSIMNVIGDYCNTSIGLLKGDKNKPLTQKTLELKHPNGGEIFLAGSDTIITWKGISDGEDIDLKFSYNKGYNWEVIESNPFSYSSIWEVPFIESDSCLISISAHGNIKNGINNILWDNYYGGSEDEKANSIIQTFDRGYLIVGESKSNDEDINNPKGDSDYWVVKLDPEGVLEWEKSFGGTDEDVATSVIQTEKGSYIVVGYSASIDGDKTSHYGSNDYWILEIDNIGDLIWEKSYGGTSYDMAMSVYKTNDGGVIVAGNTGSDDGDITNYKGQGDCWVIKLSSSGEIEWQKIYGGSFKDKCFSIIETNENDYILAANSQSIDGDVTNSEHKAPDYWVVRLDSKGEIIWENSFGGDEAEIPSKIIQTIDGGFCLAGSTWSDDRDITNFKGKSDYWITKLDLNGKLEWQKTFGGSGYDMAASVLQTYDQGFIIGGHSESKDKDVQTPIDDYDSWLVKVSKNGEYEWQKTYGHKKNQYVSSVIQDRDGNFLISGYTNSRDGITLNVDGQTDFWMVKMEGPPQPLQSDTSDAVFSIIMPEPVIQNNDIDMGQMIVGNTKDTIVSSIICNTGDAPLHVLGVDITGGDAADFLIPRGAGDFYLQKDECQDIMFEFTPSALGIRTAVATIRTTIGDFTDTINIRGVGINPLIEATTDVVDFGQFELGDSKDTNVVLIKNVGADDITITETKITGPDTEQFEMVPLPSFTITSGDDKELELKFTAKYGGRTSSIIEFHYDGVGSPLRSMLFAEGIGGEVYPQVPDAYVGERVELGLHLGRIKPEGLDVVATNFTATVSYNSTLLAPIDKNMTVTTENTTSFIKIEGELSGVSQIASVPMKVGLGTAVSSGLVVTQFQLYDANGDSVEYELEPGVGEFNVLGICEEGGTRLVNPNGEKVGLRVAQNRLNTSATIYLDLIESGQTDLIVYDQLGNAIETAYSGTPSTGSKELSLDLSNFSNGRYYIKLTTPTITKTEIIEVIR